MTEERKPPLPRTVTRDIGDPDEVYIPAPDTERSAPRMPIIPKAPRLPHEPFKLLKGREPSYVELSAQVGEVRQLAHEVLAVQRKTNLQIDHIGSVVNQRFDLFHQELALLRATVTGDHAPRLKAVELTLGQKVKAGSLAVGKGAAYTLIGGILTQAFPQYAHLIGQLLGLGGP